MEYAESTLALSRVKWEHRTILWLDYDDRITQCALADVDLFFASAESGSVALCTINIEPFKKMDDTEALKQYSELVGVNNVSIQVQDKPFWLKGIELADVCINAFETRIVKALQARNERLSDQSKLSFKRIFNLRYEDGARMATFGWILFKEAESDKLERCRLGDFTFTCSSNDAHYDIKAPLLTSREQRHLDSHLPTDKISQIPKIGIPPTDVESYSSIYRYYPNFADVEK
jgi:hypothetical protein